MNLLPSLPLRDLRPGWKEVTEDYCAHFEGNMTVCVPKGYSSNGASIPRWFQPIVGRPWESEYAEAALVHDWYCDVSDALECYNHRVTGDSVFWYLLSRNGVPYWHSVLMYYAVRMNGIIHFFLTKPIKRCLSKR